MQIPETKFHKNLLRIVGGVARQKFIYGQHTHTHNLHNLILITFTFGPIHTDLCISQNGTSIYGRSIMIYNRLAL